MKLDLSSFEKSVAQLQDALSLYQSDTVQSDQRLAKHLRAGTIQAFEYTYELSFKMLKRFLEQTQANPLAVDEMTFNQVIRDGYEKGLLKNSAEQWKEFRRNRGTTSHTYNEDKAQDVFDCIPSFLTEACFLLDALKARQES